MFNKWQDITKRLNKKGNHNLQILENVTTLINPTDYEEYIQNMFSYIQTCLDSENIKNKKILFYFFVETKAIILENLSLFITKYKKINIILNNFIKK